MTAVVVVLVEAAAAAATMVQLTLDPALEAFDDIFGRVGVWRGRVRSGVRRKGELKGGLEDGRGAADGN